ncbi:MAG: hypothetical protein LBO63_06370 [Oscillospiraceae bacterium]|jgi:hypothetical protein|nr:hypothetical protein [Oscillospiraceae bacterium]
MTNRNILQIDLFLASGAETKDIRDKIAAELDKLNDSFKARNVVFKVVRWENMSETVPETERSQDFYNEFLEPCDMCAVIIRDRLGDYTKEEFEKGCRFFYGRRQTQGCGLYAPGNWSGYGTVRVPDSFARYGIFSGGG